MTIAAGGRGRCWGGAITGRFAVLDAAGRFRWANGGFADLVGRRCEHLVGMAFEQIAHPEDVDADRKRSARWLGAAETTT